LCTLRRPNRLETQANRPAGDRGRRIFFLSGVPVIGLQCRKPALETTFGVGEVRRGARKVLREAAKFDPLEERISVHNVMAYQ
jgi:hypothetical protein